jgi:HAMP domain-containing protein
VARAILNNNQFGIMLMLNSGLPQNIRSNRDLNVDGVLADRPLGVARNSIYLPARYNIDFRYSRFVPLGGSRRAEVLLELKNLLNNQQTSAIARIVTTDAAGNPALPIPADGSAFPIAGRSGYEARQFQVGFKFYF